MDNQETVRMMEAMEKIANSLANTEQILHDVLPRMMECDDLWMFGSIIGTLVDAYADTHDVPDDEIFKMYANIVQARKEILELN